MNKFILFLTLLAVILIGFNATKLNFSNLFEGESQTAIITISAGLCAIILLQILRISKKIEALQKNKR